MFNCIKGEIVLKKRVLSGLLAIALIFGSAAALPEGVFETSSTIRASADSYVFGDFFYELSENGKFVMITKYLEKTSKTCTSLLRSLPMLLSGTIPNWRKLFSRNLCVVSPTLRSRVVRP